jgi:AraC family transcriptional regulator of adaptative response/methylated-DNA-[protein]-cysteine methyltransferase
MERPAAMSDAEQTFWEAVYWEAVVEHDRRMDGAFYYAVVTTGVYCRPSCGARLPKRENVLFFRQRERAENAGFRPCKRCKPQQVLHADPQVEMVEKVCRHMETHLDEQVTLAALGQEFGLSHFHLQRTFKEVLGITPRAYADACRLQQLKGGLQSGHSVTRAMYDAGYGSSSRLYERASTHLGMTPRTYGKGAVGVEMRYSILASPAGLLLVASTARGICSVQFGETADQLREWLREEYPQAQLSEQKPDANAQALIGQLNGHALIGKLPLDIQATAFQRRVWEHLQTIPYGATQSYAEVARAIGQPDATRAVARACSANPVAIAIPCHRVVRSDGQPGGYRWGLDRKRALLAKEREY